MTVGFWFLTIYSKSSISFFTKKWIKKQVHFWATRHVGLIGHWACYTAQLWPFGHVVHAATPPPTRRKGRPLGHPLQGRAIKAEVKKNRHVQKPFNRFPPRLASKIIV